MDLGTVREKLETEYHTIEDFKGDVYLTFENALTYNEEGSVVSNMAREMMAQFTTELDGLIQVLETEG